MALSPGDKLGPYQILSPIGKGGMGEVWKARDPRVGRDVAIKVSAAQFSERFEREAKAIGALNHPNICTLYDVGPNYLVMEYVEGATLVSKEKPGPLPLDLALKYAEQMCDALDHAHKKGITHRDLKPANVLVTKAGIKLLDFGLAKIAQTAKPMDDATVTMALTGKNEIVGTLYYMSPEQLQSQGDGRELDGRSDIFSFGLVLYEMLTGKRAIEGGSPASVIAAIMERPAPSLGDVAPAALDRVLKRCLAKDPDERFQSASDLKYNIGLAMETPVAVAAAAAAPPRSRVPWMIGVAVPTLLAAVLGFLHFSEKPAEAPLMRTTMLPPENFDIATFAVSPDQKRVVFSGRDRDGKQQLWLRPLEGIAAQPLPGTEGGEEPFWSPDGQSIGFFTPDKLKRIDVSGGPVLTLAPIRANQNRGASWGADGVILFAESGSVLKKVSAAGGTVSDASKLGAGEATHRRPSFLPDGKHFVFSAGAGSSPAPKAIRLGSVDGMESTPLIEAADSGAVYSEGYLLYLRGETLMAQPFDAGRLVVSGNALPVVENVPGGGIGTAGGFAAARGLLLHASGSLQLADLTWFDRKGNRTAALGEPGRFEGVTFSKDRSTVNTSIYDQAGNLNVWLVEAARGLRTRITVEGVNQAPVLSPDGGTIFFVGNRNRREIYRKPASGAGSEEAIYDGAVVDARTLSLTPDGKFLLFAIGGNLQILPDPLGAVGKSKPYPILKTPFNESYGQFSPDGHWILFVSNESGRDEVYVSPFPGPGPKRQISTTGGDRPRWRGDGKEIFYAARGGQIVAVEVAARNGSLEPGEAQMLFNLRTAQTPPQNWDVSMDGQRILAITPRNASDGLTIVQNWPALLKK